MTTRVYIIADNPLARVGLATLLGEATDCDIVGQGADDERLLEALEVYQPDVILWDMSWMTTLDTQNLADVLETSIPVIALINDENQTNDLWQIGVHGMLLQEAGPDRIAAATLAVSHGLFVMDKMLTEQLSTTPDDSIEPPAEALTGRELEVLQLLAEGLSNKAIAFKLGISDHTVKFHVTAIMNKLSAQSRTEAVVRATRLGLIHL
jgi:DNA-binding NarL/FixJ family response regulator